jgi:hypothetical protein
MQEIIDQLKQKKLDLDAEGSKLTARLAELKTLAKQAATLEEKKLAIDHAINQLTIYQEYVEEENPAPVTDTWGGLPG